MPKTKKTARTTTSTSSAIITRNFARAKDFLSALSPLASTWNPSPTLWAFRGQTDANWPLLPQALRKNTRLDYFPTGSSGLKSTNREQAAAEFNRLNDFFLAADARGLPIPEDTQALRSPEEWRRTIDQQFAAAMRGSTGGRWPIDSLLSLAALAQHYGVPTRLLDWSDNPLIAAYFAAKDAARWLKDPDSRPKDYHTKYSHTIGIRCLNLGFIIGEAWPASDNRDLDRNPEYLRILVVTAPRATNPNMHAQGGLFTVDRLPFKPDAPVAAVPLEVTIENKCIQMGVRKPVMYNFCLPDSEAPALLRLLRGHGVDAAMVFPGYQGVVKALEERRYWDKEQQISPFESR